MRRDLFCPAPQRASPRAAASASFSIATGMANASCKSLTGFSPRQVGKKLTSPISPVNGYTGPVDPIPIPCSFVRRAETADLSMSTVVARAFLYGPSPRVGDSKRHSNLPPESTMPTAIFVPPMSIAPTMRLQTPMYSLLPLHNCAFVWTELHFGEVSFDVRRIPPQRPLHCCLSGHPVRAHRNERLAVTSEMKAVEMNW